MTRRNTWDETAAQHYAPPSNRRAARVLCSLLCVLLFVGLGAALMEYATPCEGAHLCSFLAALHPQALGRWLRRLVVQTRIGQLELLAYDIAMAGVMSPETDRQLAARMAELQGQLADLSPITNSKDC